jgi:hypothetical protein
MPKRAFKIAALVLSHLSAFVLTAAWAVGHHNGAAFRAAWQDPLHRLGLHFDDLEPETKAALPPFEQDLQAASGKLTPPATEVLRLMKHLQDEQLARAGEICTALAWPRCDPAALTDMRKAVVQ